MFFDFISLIVSILCLIVFMMSFYLLYLNQKVNLSFMVIIFIVGIQRFQSAVTNLGIFRINSPIENYPLITLIFIPFFYFFFKEFSPKKKPLYLDAIHFVFPTAFLILDKLYSIPVILTRIVYLLFTIFYIIIIFFELKRYFIKRTKTLYYIDQTTKFLFVMYSNVILISIFLNYFILDWNGTKINQILNNFYRSSSFVWLFILSFILLNPVVLYGKDYLVSLIRKNNYFNQKIWRDTLKYKIESKDLSLFKNIKRDIPEIQIMIIEIENNFDILSKEVIDSKFLSKSLKIPLSHIKLIFKYYCRISSHDYSNILKIKYALRLIETNYLSDKTVESLSKECHFDSRITFYNNFKKFTGKNPSELT